MIVTYNKSVFSMVRFYKKKNRARHLWSEQHKSGS